MRAAILIVAAGCATAAAAPPLPGQTLTSRVDAVRDGTVRMSFPARPGVCGDGRGSVWVRGSDRRGSWSDGGWVCLAGPVRVAIGRADAQTVSVRTRVGGRWTPASSNETDLGDVSSVDAARYLTALARTLGGGSGGEAISAAAYADGFDPAPEFTALVRDAETPLESRRQALFWLGQSDMPTPALVALYDNLSPFALREHFTFVLSQRHDDASLDKLIDVATRDRDVEIRKRAMFWLGQSKDPRAVKFFHDVLTR